MKRAPAAWRRPDYLPAETKIGQPDVIAAMLPYVRNPGCVIQAGSHVGVWAAELSAHFKQVLAFEPLLHLWQACVDAITAENALVMPCALSRATGHVNISVGAVERFGGSSAVAPQGTTFPAIAMDDLPGQQVANLGAILLDIEGHELEALQGAARLLKQWRPVVVVEENDKSLRYRPAGAVAEYLASFGYRQVAAFDRDLIFAAR
ncbi:MAG TPA: FkbM family methyltransferase [Mycolicibacterium fallax]|nr:FkbM family methyltransferase [Mycolicibacterium fallax]